MPIDVKLSEFFVNFLQDIQVPVCPLCNIPIPVKRGEMPDIKVGEHIDRDCRSDPAQRKRKVHIIPDASGSPSVCKQAITVRLHFRFSPINVPKAAVSRRR